MSIRKRRLMNKRIKPKSWVFSYWFRRAGEKDWQQSSQTHSSRLPPFSKAVIPFKHAAFYLYPKLEAK